MTDQKFYRLAIASTQKTIVSFPRYLDLWHHFFLLDVLLQKTNTTTNGSKYLFKKKREKKHKHLFVPLFSPGDIVRI